MCVKCRTVLPPETTFCPMCGQKVEELGAATLRDTPAAVRGGNAPAEPLPPPPGPAPGPLGRPRLLATPPGVRRDEPSSPAHLPRGPVPQGHRDEHSSPAHLPRGPVPQGHRDEPSSPAHLPRGPVPHGYRDEPSSPAHLPRGPVPQSHRDEPSSPAHLPRGPVPHGYRDEHSSPAHLPGPALPIGQQLPGTPTYIPIAPRPLRIALGLVMLGLGMWALILFFPDHTPSAALDPLDETSYLVGHVAAIGLSVVGLLLAITGALYRAHTEVLCRRCHRQVIGWKTSFGLMCPMDKHYARISWPVVIATLGFWLSAVAFLGTISFIVLSA